MDIRVLGAGSGMPSAALNCSAILVQANGQNFLLDCGEGVSKSLPLVNPNPDFLDAIIITHYHPDHVGGIFLLLQMLYLGKRSKAMTLFLPEREDDFRGILQMFYTFPEKFGFRLDLQPMEQLGTYFPQLTCMQNDHLTGYTEIIRKNQLTNRQKAYSIRINSPEGDFVYSSDISTTDSIWHLLQGAHTLLVDAGHPEAEQILKLKQLGLKLVLMTHEPHADLRQALRDIPSSLFQEAQEGEVYHI
jgi:ribonuclease BN (tRNA processing enzyme)